VSSKLVEEFPHLADASVAAGVVSAIRQAFGADAPGNDG